MGFRFGEKSAGFCKFVKLPGGSILNFRIGSVSSIGRLIAGTLFPATVSDSQILGSSQTWLFAICALFCGLAFALFCAHLRSFACICVFLRPTAFSTTAFGNCRDPWVLTPWGRTDSQDMFGSLHHQRVRASSLVVGRTPTGTCWNPPSCYLIARNIHLHPHVNMEES